MIIAMIIVLIQIVIVTIMPMIIERSIILASVEIMRGRWAEKEQLRSFTLALTLPSFCPRACCVLFSIYS